MAEGFGMLLTAALYFIFLLPVGVFLFFCMLGFFTGRMRVINASAFSKIWPVLVSALVAGGICSTLFYLLIKM